MKKFKFPEIASAEILSANEMKSLYGGDMKTTTACACQLNEEKTGCVGLCAPDFEYTPYGQLIGHPKKCTYIPGSSYLGPYCTCTRITY